MGLLVKLKTYLLAKQQNGFTRTAHDRLTRETQNGFTDYHSQIKTELQEISTEN
jgi:hypothetical protein